MNTTPKIVRMKNVIQNLKHLTFILTTISYFAPLCDQGQSSSSLIKALEHFFQLKKKKTQARWHTPIFPALREAEAGRPW